MESSFWHKRWETNDTPFHEPDVNPLLVRYFQELRLSKGSRVFLPLCGRTNDFSWLLSNGYRVAGAELSKIAIDRLFEDLGVQPQIVEVGETSHYSGPNIDIYVGDIFHLSRSKLGLVDAIWDRAAFVALPAEMRARYSSHLMAITDTAPQLLICYEYDQLVMNGPPFSVSREEVHQHYDANYSLTTIASTTMPGGLKGKCPAKESVWLLSERVHGLTK